jgi:hypothetical protein
VSDDGLPNVYSYETAQPGVLLPAGTYFAMFTAPTSDTIGGVVGNAGAYVADWVYEGVWCSWWGSDTAVLFLNNAFRVVGHVPAATEQITALANLMLATGAKQGIVNSLYAKLKAVQRALTAANAGNRADAMNILGAFINDVNAQSGKALTADQASQLIGVAQRIQAVLG